jgi:hypothetical protein
VPGGPLIDVAIEEVIELGLLLQEVAGGGLGGLQLALQPKVEALHAAALRAAGAGNGAPGPRQPNCYAAFVLDPRR